MCALAAPDVFGVGEDDGYAYVKIPHRQATPSDRLKDAHVSEVNREAVQAAAASCPMQAIDISDD
jgi:ferredoxin